MTLWRGAQLAIDTTLVSPLRRDGTVRAGQAITTARLWTMLDAGKRTLTPKFPVKVGELASSSWQPKWRWSAETAQFLTALRRWSAILACTAARGFTVSLLDRRPVTGTGEGSLQSKRFRGKLASCERGSQFISPFQVSFSEFSTVSVCSVAKTKKNNSSKHPLFASMTTTLKRKR